MIYGINLLLWNSRFTDELVPVCQSLRSLGYDGVEIPLLDMDLDYAAIGKQLDDIGLRRTAVTIRTDQDDPISDDPAVRQKGIDANRRAIDACVRCGAEALVGPLHSALGKFSGRGPTPQQWQWAVECMRATGEHATQAGVNICIESVNRFECFLVNTQADATKMAREVDLPSVGMLFDTFHCNIEEKNVQDAIRVGGDKLFHVHISENDRSTPGSGGVNWQAAFDTLAEVGYDGWMVIEAFGLALPEIAAATKIWRKMHKDEMEVASEGFQFMKTEVERRR